MLLNRENVMQSPGVRNFAKLILTESLKHDIVDAVKDVALALTILKQELQKQIYKPFSG